MHFAGSTENEKDLSTVEIDQYRLRSIEQHISINLDTNMSLLF